MRIVLGLGNPGDRYARTRHNVGFRVVDLVAARAGARFAREEATGDTCWTARLSVRGEEVLLAKPRTYMNRSGRAAQAVLARTGGMPVDLLVVHDDADLELGRIRIRTEGGAGGHNGLRSIIDVLRTQEFPRVKLGVRGTAREESDLADYVLTDFEPDEAAIVDGLVGLGVEAVEAVLAEGVAASMNRFNGSKADGAA